MLACISRVGGATLVLCRLLEPPPGVENGSSIDEASPCNNAVRFTRCEDDTVAFSYLHKEHVRLAQYRHTTSSQVSSQDDRLSSIE